MEQLQALVERPGDGGPRLVLDVLVVAGKVRLHELQVPVAERAPDELVDAGGRVVGAERLQRGGHLAHGAFGLASNPAIERVLDASRVEAFAADALVHLGEARRIPQLGCEVAIALDALLGEADVAALGRQRGHREAQGVGAVLVNEAERVFDVALGFAHLLALLVEDEAMDGNLAEWHFALEGEAHHHHPGDPEEDDVAAGDEQRGRVIAGDLRRIFRPAEGRERPEGGREPRVEHVGIAGEFGRLAVAGLRGRHRLGLSGGDEHLAVGPIPRWDLVAPPQLARDAPRLDVVHPLEVGLFPVLRHEFGPAVLDGADRVLGQLAGVAIPLVGQPRLDDHAGAVAVRNGVGRRLDLGDEAERMEVGDDAHARFKPLKPTIGLGHLGVQLADAVEDVDLRQVVALADIEVVEIMGGRDFDRAGALLRVGVFVGNDGYVAVGEWQAHGLADQRRVALVGRVHGHGRVTEHGLGPRRRHDDEAGRVVAERIAEVVHVARRIARQRLAQGLDVERLLGIAVGPGEGAALFQRIDLEVGDRRLQLRVPVDQPLVLVDQAAPMQLDEHRDDGR